MPILLFRDVIIYGTKIRKHLFFFFCLFKHKLNNRWRRSLYNMQPDEHQSKSVTCTIIKRKTSYWLHGQLSSRVLDSDIGFLLKGLIKYIIVYLDHVTYPNSILNHLSRETTRFKGKHGKILKVWQYETYTCKHEQTQRNEQAHAALCILQAEGLLWATPGARVLQVPTCD